MKKFISILLASIMLFGFSSQSFADDNIRADSLTESVGVYLYETSKNPVVGPIGGEWAVLGLARSNMDIPDEYFENYYRTVTKHIKDCDGILHEKKNTLNIHG